MQIIVLGMHRSGTSLITRMINMMGAYVGPEGSTLPFDIDNPKGYWERKDLVQMNVALFKLYGATWPNVMNWPTPPRPGDTPPALLNAMRSLIFNLDGFRPWVMKDPRLCLTLPYWQPLLEVPVCVVVYRDPLEIARSLARRDKLAIPFERGLALWEFYAVSLLNASAALPHVFAAHADFLSDPVHATGQLYAALTQAGVQGLRQPSAREILAFIEPSLYRARGREATALTEYQRYLLELLQGRARATGMLTVSAASAATLQPPVYTPYP